MLCIKTLTCVLADLFLHHSTHCSDVSPHPVTVRQEAWLITFYSWMTVDTCPPFGLAIKKKVNLCFCKSCHTQLHTYRKCQSALSELNCNYIWFLMFIEVKIQAAQDAVPNRKYSEFRQSQEIYFYIYIVIVSQVTPNSGCKNVTVHIY